MIPAEAVQIIARARAIQPSWAALPVARRCEVIGALRHALARQCDAIAALIAQETRKPLLDALSGDVLVTLEHLRYCQLQAGRALRPRSVRRSSIFYAGARFEEYLEPHGVVLIFGPSNYPLQLSLIPAISALVAGNAVVLKCSEHAPKTAAVIAELCATAGFPDNLIQVIHDSPDSASALFDAGPDFLFFTGSSSNGQQVAQLAAKRLIPAILELGGKDPALVFADCHLKRAVEGVTYGAFCNAGRVCVGIRRVYVEAQIYKEFVARLSERMSLLRVGNCEESDLCSLPHDLQPALRAHIQEALSRGATLLWPPDSSLAGEQPALLEGVPADALLLTEESFGPVLCVAPFRDETEAVTLANNSTFALGSSIWTRDQSRARRIASQLTAGSCSINDVIRNIGNPWAAFGGNRRSGYGRYRGAEGFRAFTRVKSVMVASGRRAHQIHWFPFHSRTTRRLSMLLRVRHGADGFGHLMRQLLPLLLGILVPAGFAQHAEALTHVTITLVNAL